MIERHQVIDENTGELIAEKEQHVEQNKNFVQFYRREIHTIAMLGRTDPLALAIWLWIVERMGYDNALVCSMQPLVDDFQKTRQTISKKISFLRKRGYLAVAKTGTTNVYMINAEIVWASSASRRRKAEFRANVVLAESEQTLQKNRTNREANQASPTSRNTNVRSLRVVGV